MNGIEKPIMMIRQEFIDKLVEDINTCDLPLFVIEPILKDIYMDVKNTLQKQYENEMYLYMQAIQEHIVNNQKQEQEQEQEQDDSE